LEYQLQVIHIVFFLAHIQFVVLFFMVLVFQFFVEVVIGACQQHKNSSIPTKQTLLVFFQFFIELFHSQLQINMLNPLNVYLPLHELDIIAFCISQREPNNHLRPIFFIIDLLRSLDNS
jgi:hypothetical protein